MGPDTAQLIELTLRVHLHGASVVYEGQDSAQLKFKIQIRKALWVQNLVKHQVGPRMDVSSNGSIVILYVGIKSGKEHGWSPQVNCLCSLLAIKCVIFKSNR